MRIIGIILLIIIVGLMVGCDTELGHSHEDHDHDGDGVQDHSAEDHQDEEHEGKEHDDEHIS